MHLRIDPTPIAKSSIYRRGKFVIDLRRSNAILTGRAAAQAVQIADGLRFSTLQEALDQMRTTTLPADVAAHFEQVLTERATQLLAQASDNLASEALALGRHDEMTVFANDIQEAVYTSLLDENTCDPCAAADGTTVEFGSADYYRLMPPYSECDGRGRCRCQFVLTLKTEAPAGAIPIAPLSPTRPWPPLPRGPFPPPLPTPPTPRRVVPPEPRIVPPEPPVVPPPAPPPPVRVTPPPPPPVEVAAPPAPPAYTLPPLAPKGVPAAEELQALRERLSFRDLYAVQNPIARNDAGGFAKAYELPDGRKVILIKETDSPLSIRSLQELGFDVRRVKDVIAIIPNRLSGSGFFYGETKELSTALLKRRRFSAIADDLYRKAGYTEEHIAEMRRAATLEKSLLPPREARVPASATPLDEGATKAITRQPQEAFGFDAPSPAVTPVFTKPAEVETWLKATFPRMHTTPITVRDLRAVNAVVAEYNRLANVFSSVKSEVTAFGTKALGGVQRGRFKGNEWAHVGRFGTGQQVVGLSPARFADPAQLFRDLVSSEVSGFHPPGANTIASIMTHEFGHILDNRIKSLAGVVVRVETDAAGDVVKRITVGDISARYRPYITGMNVRSAISGYATKSDAEAFAEAFASLSWTPEAQLSSPAANLRDMLAELKGVLR